MPIKRQSGIPLYRQLREILKDKIEKGEFSEGDLIPSEREICETYGVSRITARQAILDLVNDGLLYREGGRGTFVASKSKRKLAIALGACQDRLRQKNQVLQELHRQRQKYCREFPDRQTVFEKQFDVIMSSPKIETLCLTDKGFKVRTGPLFCRHDKTGTVHLIGSFWITFNIF